MRATRVAMLGLLLVACGGRTLAEDLEASGVGGEPGTRGGAGGYGLSGPGASPGTGMMPGVGAMAGTGAAPWSGGAAPWSGGGTGNAPWSGGGTGNVPWSRGGAGNVGYGGMGAAPIGGMAGYPGTGGVGAMGGVGGAGAGPNCLHLLSTAGDVYSADLRGVAEGWSWGEAWPVTSLGGYLPNTFATTTSNLAYLGYTDGYALSMPLPGGYLGEAYYGDYGAFGMGVVRGPGEDGTLHVIVDQQVWRIEAGNRRDPRPLPSLFKGTVPELADSDAGRFYALAPLGGSRQLALACLDTLVQTVVDSPIDVLSYDLVHALGRVILFTGDASSTTVHVHDEATLEVLWTHPQEFPFSVLGAGLGTCW